MYFGKAADDFNQSIQGQGANGPQLIANTSNAFTSKLAFEVFGSRLDAHHRTSGLGWLCVFRCASSSFIGKVTCSCDEIIKYFTSIDALVPFGDSSYYSYRFYTSLYHDRFIVA